MGFNTKYNSNKRTLEPSSSAHIEDEKINITIDTNINAG
jgi:hypothetical protein